MSVIISPVLPFPNILWWALAQQAALVQFDLAEHFEKMSYRNRYYITGANGLITLSIPLADGREQRRVMGEVRVCNKDRWQIQHWRTLTSVYRRAPYFEHYETSLQQLFEQPFERLADFNLASLHWLKLQLNISFEEESLKEYKKEYSGVLKDLRRNFKPGFEKHPQQAAYYQLFSERNGFLPNLSMLDLLFTEGPHALHWLKANQELIRSWDKKN